MYENMLQLNSFCITEYITVEDSDIIPCDFVRTSSECESAAQLLNLTDITVVDDLQNGAPHDPPFCYFEAETLKFNKLGTNTGPCTTSDLCICRQHDYCAENPCVEGRGHCDNDTECEGLLVCGRMNCGISSVANCCTHSCNNDANCQSGECNSEFGHCRLNSDTIDWSWCGQDSPCVDGEGDCDHHSDCEGTLICGNDNCENGPSDMDCCTNDGN